ncbi:FtsX-like permease family protein [Sorangium sp. So ce321]|uniref:ABC transporter permease n=1 Tax=Sorangium sp. So ce321 TaxID=3133300 RepID=UPI003F648E7C
MNLVSIAARNALRNRFRTLLTILGTAVAVLAFVLLRTVLTAWNVAIEHAAKDRIATRHTVSLLMSLPKRYAELVKEVPGIPSVSYATLFAGKDPRDPNNVFASMAVDSSTFFELYDEMVVTPVDMARWRSDRTGAILGDVLARKLGVNVGDRINLVGTIYPGDWQFTVSGIYQATRKSIDRSQFIFHWDYLNDSLPDLQREQIGWVMARIDDPERSAEICAAVDRLFADKDIQTVTTSERAFNLSFMAMLSAILTGLKAASVLILVTMLMILGNTIAMGVRERTREYGVLRALGFQPRHIWTFILGEALTMGVLAGILGLAVSYPVVEIGMGRWLEENMGAMFPYFRIDPTTMVAAVLLASALSVTAALIPAYRASKFSVADSLRRVT